MAQGGRPLPRAISNGVRKYLARVTLTADDVTLIATSVSGVHVAVVDERGADVPAGMVGDIRVSGPGIVDGDWNESAMTRKTLQQGWVQTGDLRRSDEDGYLWSSVGGRT